MYIIKLLEFVNRVRLLFIVWLLVLSALTTQAQNWQIAYNATLDAYYNEDYSNAFAQGEKALTQASSSMEKLFTLKILSTICNETGNYDKGIAFSKQEIEICSSESVPDSVFMGSLNNLTNNYLGLQAYKKAIPGLQKMIAIGSELFDANNLELNLYKSDLGYAYYMTQNFDSAIYFLADANSRLLSIDGGAEDYLMNELTLGQSYYQNKQLDLSLKTLQSLKDILESNDLQEDQLYAETMEVVGLIQYTQGEFVESQKAYEAASLTYSQLGFTPKDLEDLNKQLALVYIKTNQAAKSDSVQALLSTQVGNQNIIVNQLSLAYKNYLNGNLVEAKTILTKVKEQLKNSSDADLLIAEYILLNTRINLKLYGKANIDSITTCSQLFAASNKKDKEAEAHLIKAKIYQAQNESDQAIASLTTANQIAATLENNYDLKYSIAVDIVNIYLQRKLLHEAKTTYEKSIHGFLNDEFSAKLSYVYAIFLQVNGYNFEAFDVLQKLVATAEYPALLKFQEVFAKVQLDLGQVKNAHKTYVAIDGYLAGSGKQQSIAYGENLTQLGRVNVILGNYTSADKFYLKGMELLEAKAETEPSIIASSYNSYAIFQQTIGNYDKAKLYYSKAKESAQSNPTLQVDIIQNLATLSQSQGEYADAIIFLKEAVNTYGSIYGENHPYYATALQNLANAYSKKGEPKKALSLLEEALSIDKANGLENSISYVNKLHNLGVMLQESFEYKKARETFLIVLEAREKQLGDKHPDYIYSLYNMAVLMQKMGANNQAKQYFKEVIEKYDFQLESFFPYLSEEEKSKYYSKIKEAFTAFQDFAIEYSASDPSINGELYNFQINHKAILLSSSKSMRKTIARSNDKELINLYEQWVDKKKSLAKYYSVPKNELTAAGINIDNIVKEANLLEKELSLKSNLFSSSVAKNEKEWQTIQKHLKEDEAAIEIIRLKKNIRTDSIWYAALIITPKVATPQIVVLHNGKQLESKFFKYYINKIKFKLHDELSYANYWKSIDKSLEGVNKIYLSSDGIFNKINVSSLYNPATSTYMLDQLVVHNVTNTIELMEGYKPLQFDKNFSLDLIGDPLFSQTGNESYTIDPLPSTRVEIQTIDSIAQSKNINSIQLLGKGASEANIKKIESPSVIHIATHGFFLADKSNSEDVYTIGNNPLMRSGLLFSGSENHFRGDHIKFQGSLEDEDGVLTALEVLNIDFSTTELVVLSACETGLGEVKNGEGVYGLQRAFIIAGAKSILMSLWKVDDQTTKELMILYYENLFNGVNKFEALNLAQKKLKETNKNPYYWGAFIISGI